MLNNLLRGDNYLKDVSRKVTSLINLHKDSGEIFFYYIYLTDLKTVVF